MRVKWNVKKSVCMVLVAASSSANADPVADKLFAINRQSLCSGGFFYAKSVWLPPTTSRPKTL
jgi:hypothetical protein